MNVTLFGSNTSLYLLTTSSVIRGEEPTDLSPNLPAWLKWCIIGVLSLVIIITVVGNTLVILAVITTRRLRTVTNCFVMSLAVADWLVGIFVMPPGIPLHLSDTWNLGWILCDIWISLDVLLSTASILSLCAISVDRYLAVTQPLKYSRRRRSKRLALSMILIVWLAAAAITCPPMLGWYEPGRHEEQKCRYNLNRGYVIFSAVGSFFLPMTVMLYVYVRISCVIAQRHDQLATMDSRTRVKKQKLVTRDESDRGSSECDDTQIPIRCTSVIAEPLNTHNNHSRSLRSNHTYSFTSEQMQTPQRTSSMYTTATTVSNSRSRPESLNLDVSVLNFEPANRVSSFRRETKTAQTLSIVVGGFVACWLPFFITYLLMPFLQIPVLLVNMLTWLGWINSAINPFIYAFYSPDFRIAFWRLTFKHCSKNHRADFAFQNK